MPGLHISSLSSPAPPTGLHNPTSISVIHMSSSSSSTPHTRIHTPSANIAACPSPHTIPSPTSIGGPSPIVGEHGTPSQVLGHYVAPTSIGDPNDVDQDPPLHDRR